MSLPNRIARLNADGTQDMSFAGGAGLNGPATCVAVLQDGKIFVGGAFTSYQSAVRLRAVILNPDGGVNSAKVDANWDVLAASVQSDGSVVLAGRFTQLTGLTMARVARLTNKLIVQPSFAPDCNGMVCCLALTTDGKLYAGGAFSEVGDYTRSRLVRIFSDPADSLIHVVSASLVQWLRGGSLPETARVTWEIDTGSGYGPLPGVATRIMGGWQIQPTTALTGAGSVRATAHLHDSHSGGMQRRVVSYNFAPEISVLINGVDVPSGGAVSFGDVQTGSTKEITVVIRNIGLQPLTISGATLGGTAVARYSRTPPAGVVPVGGETTCVVRLSPIDQGTQPGTLTIANDDANEGTYVLNLGGNGTPGPGGVDPTWQASATGQINTIVTRPGDAVAVGGAIRTINAQARKSWGQVSTITGAVLPQSGSASDREVRRVLPLLDGRTLLLASTATATRLWLVKADGVTDTAFNVSVTGGVARDMCLMPDGAVVIAGNYTRIGGLARGGCAKLLPVTLRVDAAFDPVTADYTSVLCVTDGSLWLGLGTVPAVGRPVLHLTSAGTVALEQMAANTYQSNLRPTAVSADGGLYLTGWRDPGYEAKLIKISANGTEDTEFNRAWASVSAPHVQADGKLILIGKAAVGDSGAARLRRLIGTGEDDTSFTGSVVRGAFCLDSAGRIYGQAADFSLRRLLNSEGAQALTVVNASRVQWLRSGAVPEVQWVRLELQEVGSSTWTLLKLCSRIPGGWQADGLSLPRAGRVRVLACTGYGLVESVKTFADLAVPDISVELANVPQAEGALLSFAGRIIPQSSDLVLTLRNTGNADLTGLVAAVTGDYRVVSLGLPGQADPTTLSPGQSTELQLRFTPLNTTGFKAGSLVVTCNVPGLRGKVTLRLTGNSITNPTATTVAATAIAQTAARLRGSFRANDDTATPSFRYRIQNGSFWTEVMVDSASGFAVVDRSLDIGGLLPNTRYEFQARITNSLRSRDGDILSFRTLS